MSLPRLTQVHIDGVDVSSYVSAWNITKTFEQSITKAEVLLKSTVSAAGLVFDEDNAFHTIEIWRGITLATDTKIFQGEVASFTKDGKNIYCKCYDDLHKAVRAEVTKSFDMNIDTEAGVISEIFLTLINDYTTLTADATTVQASGAVHVLDKFICNHADVYERCEKLAEILDWQFYYNPTDNKVYFEPKGTPSNANILSVGTNIIEVPKWNYDKSKLCNKFTVIGAEEIVETTELGQINVTSGYTQTDVLLNNKPVFTKVYCDAANPPTTLRYGGSETTSTTYHYSVDDENKKIVWHTADYTPNVNDWCETRYGYRVPRPVLASNSASISTHGEHRQTVFKSELKKVTDVEEYVKNYVAKFGEPFISTTLKVVNIDDLYPGETIRVVDSVNSIDKELLINEVTMVYPYRFDQAKVGDKKYKTSSWGVETMDRIRRLEEELGKSQDILIQIIDFNREFKPRRRYFEVQKKTYPDPSADVFILGSFKYGILGTNKLGDTTGVSYSTVKLVQGKMTYEEYAYDVDFHDAVNSTATFSIATNDITFAAGQVWYSNAIDLGTTLSHVTVDLGTVVGTLLIEISSDGKATWQTVTEGVRTSVTSDGTGTYIRITENAAGAATIDLTQDSFGQNTESVIKVLMEE